MKRLIGAKILEVEVGKGHSSMLTVVTDKGVMEFCHYQECCESVELEDGEEDLKKMIGEVILFSEEVSSDEVEPLKDDWCCGTWTFYKISTINHDCTLRFFGTSNGYYSEEVDLEFEEVKNEA